MATGVDARLLKSTRFPPEFSQKVDMQKVNLQVMKKWIASKISDILGSEDDVVIELVFNLIEGPRYPDIKSLQIQLTGFLDKDTAVFCKDLWKLLLSAQSSPQGVPKELLEAKKLELIQEKIEADRAAETAKQRRDDWDRRDREVADLKDRDRRDRAAARGDTWQGRRGDQGASGGEVAGQDRPALTSVIPGTHMDAIVTFHEEDVVVDAPTKADENRPLDHVRHRHRPGRAQEVAVPPEALINRIKRQRPVSHGEQADTRKRSRSPRGDTYRGRANKRTERGRPGRPSRSLSSERNSPAPKRRRYSPSRSRSVTRRRRPARDISSSRSERTSDSRSRSRSHSYSRSRSRSSSASPDRRTKRRPNHGRGQQPSRQRDSPKGRRRNSSSASSRSRIRENSADVSEDGSRALPTKPEAEVPAE
ncbi:uncharacterized protein FFUJ_01284 [Fusarium fujikuroi IMI 58289]|uniref:PWI domain-containing protein n=1 Tax=Gibberella fujikuroi (strain CBS 195.34 / IMI 58289 / NRRL A-6831) TaxID=1279085 RepID=S0DM31_GIBF5|nr:uncharacterized protein FFUJ_01284 [Fusarium fujikuroi IMI 58289]CCT63491.1 uncharacterized protein FFUJ_01284 [Fusarium fujikuroi IMI 58289]